MHYNYYCYVITLVKRALKRKRIKRSRGLLGEKEVAAGEFGRREWRWRGLLEDAGKKPTGGVNRFVSAEFWADRVLRRFIAAARGSASRQAGRQAGRQARRQEDLKCRGEELCYSCTTGSNNGPFAREPLWALDIWSKLAPQSSLEAKL
jgi:hypothetical protein